MTVHERNISASIDPVKLDRLAEVARITRWCWNDEDSPTTGGAIRRCS